MATLLKPATEHASPSKDAFSEVNEVFMPKDTLDQPCNVVLVVKDGKEFKAHRQVLSEASPFFEKLLNSDMKESKEGIVRLETFSESVVGNTLEFIYNGNVQILTEDNARDLIVMADYLFVKNLKTLAEEVLVQKLNTSNCISIHYFSERYQCTELFSNATKFILANFSAVYAASREEILNMSSKEIQMWISSDEINVTAEEDVFNIILAWIDHGTRKRKKYFPELFRQVRLVYVSRDFLWSNIATNDLVNDDEDCLSLVEDAMRLIESRNYDNLPVTPRKCLWVPVIVACRPFKGHPIHCYFPREDWCGTLGEMSFDFVNSHLISCHGKIYGLRPGSSLDRCEMASFDPYSKYWMPLQCKEDRVLEQIFVVNENEMCALVSEPCAYHAVREWTAAARDLFDLMIEFCDKEKHVSFITKYKPESNSWEEISSFDHMNLRENVCIVVNDNFVYFIGGAVYRHSGWGSRYSYLTDVERYDLCKNRWDKVADIHIDARNHITGAAAHEKIFIADGLFCEVFIETTNEWQFVSTPDVFNLNAECRLLSIDDRLYMLAKVVNFKVYEGKVQHRIKVECYDPDKNEWSQKTEIPITYVDFFYYNWTYCSINLFKGFLNNEPEKEDTRETKSPSAQSSRSLSSLRLQAENTKQAEMTSPSAHSLRDLFSLRLQAENSKQAEITSPSAQSSRDLSSLRLQAENTKQAEMTSPFAQSPRDLSSLRLQAENTKQAEMAFSSAQSSRDLPSFRLQAENSKQAEMACPSAQSSRDLSSLRLQAENTKQAEMTSPSNHSSSDFSSLGLQAENTKQAEMTSHSVQSSRDLSSLRLQAQNTKQAEMISPSAQSSRD
ncbi:hypothetical protein ACROYT_G038605 [Oculina patagonica]